jgi:N-formylglutamate amidohydrolase
MTTTTTNSNIEVLEPLTQSVPVVFASPHSGLNYTQAFIESSNLSPHQLRRSEDAFVNEIFASAPEFGAPFLLAHFPRAFVDPNRRVYELDPTMFSDPLPRYVITKSSRIVAGLGTIPRVVSIGGDIYRKKLTFEEAKQRIEDNYVPYHDTLSSLLNQTRAKFGIALLIDCHSMPSADTLPQSKFSVPLADIIIGDCHGKSCDPLITDTAEQICRDMGLSVARNKPYAGGYTTKHYGQPKYNFHSLQIEIKRSLYMNELRIERGPGLAQLIRQMRRLINTMTTIDFSAIIAPTQIAAE